jgi:hypothetical protein
MILIAMLPSDYFFLYIAALYTPVIIYDGTTTYMSMDKSVQIKYTLLTAALVIVMPYILKILLFLIMPGLRVQVL